MTILELIIIAIGLSMDAFAVSIGKGLSLKKIKLSHALKVGLWFGGFQALMPIFGYLLGSTFAEIVSAYDHWVAFVLLALIGGNMIKESLEKDCECNEKSSHGFGITTMFTLAVATSIDALAVGITFAMEFDKIPPVIGSSLIIAVITFAVCLFGVAIGKKFGGVFKEKAQILGGSVLVLIGLKIFIEDILSTVA